MMEHLPRLMESGVCCFKIEGRMKTEIYIATVVGAYRRAMDDIRKKPGGLSGGRGAGKDGCAGSWTMISHRVYDTGFTSASRRVCGEAVGVTQEGRIHGLCAGCVAARRWWR